MAEGKPAENAPAPEPSTREPVNEKSLKEIGQEILNSITHPENALLEQLFVKFEESTKLQREQLAYGVGGLLSLYLIFGSLAQLICNLIGCGYPAYASVKAVRTKSKKDDTQWLIYWTVFGSFSVIDFFAERIMYIFPFYWLAKSLFFLYLAAPVTRGALRLYVKFVDPAVTRLDAYYHQYTAGSTGNSVRTAVPTQQPAADAAPEAKAEEKKE
uniref:Receptor expression-enhancing protein n=1 Tax=Panagrolaimus sp. JU765 TaxID=591449 RepID=A0AC34R7K1_9BILA